MLLKNVRNTNYYIGQNKNRTRIKIIFIYKKYFEND